MSKKETGGNASTAGKSWKRRRERVSRAAIAAEGMTLEPGQSIRMVCPFCGGGASGERSMSIKLSEENGLLLYHCFRANCPAAGVIGNTGNVIRMTRPAPSTWQPWDCSGFNAYIPEYGMDKVNEWRLSVATSGILWDDDTHRLALPVYGPMEDLRGYVLRAVDNRRPKTLSARLRNDVPFQSWTRRGSHLYQPGRIYVVEDIPSAERLRYLGRQAVALLGCTPSEEALGEIATEARRRGGCELAIALDADATQQALRLQRQYGMRGSSRVLVLPKDIKDMTDIEVIEWLNANS